MRAADLPPEILDTMLAELARECVEHRRSLGDSNCRADEVLIEAYCNAGGKIARAESRINALPISVFAGMYQHSDDCSLMRGGFDCSCSPPTTYAPVINKP